MNNHIRVLCLIVGAALLTASQPNSTAAVIDDRLNERLDAYIANPQPNPNDPDPGNWTWGQAGYALATFKRYPAAGNIATARTYIDNLCNLENPLPADPNDALIYFKIPMLVRIYLDPSMNGNLTQANKDNLERMLWQFTKSTSKLVDARGSVWRIIDSENHDIIRKSTWMLACQALKYAGAPYGGSLTLTDGATIDSHLAAWKAYFYEYLRQRAREGLSCEIASAYNVYNLECLYNIADLSEDANLKNIAKDTLTLWWADCAAEIDSATGVRQGAGTRWYHDWIPSAPGAVRDITYCYNWHDQILALAAQKLLLAISPYRVPGIVEAIGAANVKAPFLNTTRRYGKGGPWDANGVYTVTFGANNASDIRRDIWCQPDFVIGGLTLRTDKTDLAVDAYIALIDQNRAMGAFFAYNWGDRVVFHGIGLPDGDHIKDFCGVTGICGTRCLVAARDKNKTDPNSVRLFVSDGNLQNNKIDDTGWVFTRTGASPFSVPGTEVYVGIRIANGGYTQTAATGGIYLDFVDKNSPVIMEVNSGTDFTAFKNDCKNNPFTYAASKLTYTSSAGDTYEYWANSGTLPTKNGATVNLNPTKTYNSPYLYGSHGSDIMTIMYPGSNTVTLDFNYTQSPMWDDYQTRALWHMDAITGGKILDDDKFNTTRNNDLTLFGGATVSVFNSKFSNGLILNGTNAYGKAVVQWLSYPTARIDLWFRPDIAPTTERTLVTAGATWDIRQINGDVKFYVWTPNSGFFPPSITVPNGATVGVWHHVTATVDAAGIMTLKVDNFAPVTGGNGEAMKVQNADITVGNKEGTTRWFDGMIDDVKIRTFNIQ
jgi:hypothetical protein